MTENVTLNCIINGLITLQREQPVIRDLSQAIQSNNEKYVKAKSKKKQFLILS